MKCKYGDIYERDGVSTIDQLKPVTEIKDDGVIRYSYHQMDSIVNCDMGIDTRNCYEYFSNETDLFDAEEAATLYNTMNRRTDRLDYWHFAYQYTLRREVRNDQTNSVYVGTPDGIDMKKIKCKPKPWQLHIMEKWNKHFSHLADKHGWIKVELWW